MGNLLDVGSAWLEQMRVAHCSSQVVYRRGATDTTVNATYGATKYEEVDAGGVSVESRVWDFLIAADEINEPRAGDQIIADGQKYELLPVGSDGVWRWSDPFRRTYRIHTRQIGVVT